MTADMSSKGEAQRRLDRIRRLRKLGLRRGARGLSPPRTEPAATGPDILPGEAVDTRHGETWVRVARFTLAEHPELAGFLQVRPGCLAALGEDPALARLAPGKAAFVDTETTGLAIGAGTYTFMIGIGTYESGAGREGGDSPAIDTFVVRQFFMRNPAEERAQLHLVEQALAACTGIVSFNGRSFDLPLIESRFILHRMPPPLPTAPHLDLLPPARRIWRARHGSCTLGNLEQQVLGVSRTQDDVPGWMIPDVYRRYFRTGQPDVMLARVFYHNLVDITSMPALAAKMASYFDRPAISEHLTALHPAESISLARCYERLSWPEAGETAYRAALADSLTETERKRALRDLAYLLKRQGRRDEAAEIWETWISSVPGQDLTPYIELAKHHEWHTKDLAAARGWTAWALRMVEDRPSGLARDELVTELQHRLARLERKLAKLDDAPTPGGRADGTRTNADERCPVKRPPGP